MNKKSKKNNTDFDYSELIDFAKKYGNIDREKWNKAKMKNKKRVKRKNPDGTFSDAFAITKKSLNSGQIAYLNRLNKFYNDNKSARVLSVPKKRGESKAKYKKRLETIKGNMGQENSPLNFPVLNIPADAKFSTTSDNRIIVKRDTDLGTFREEIFPLHGADFYFRHEGDFMSFLISFCEDNRLFQKLENYADIILSLQCGEYLMRKGVSITILEDFADHIEWLVDQYVRQLIEDGEEEEAEKLLNILFTAITVRYYPKEK